tara:strand:+ start:867 stop:1145 length:279 start_codon:yes stop_codon:yes gene_type:complete
MTKATLKKKAPTTVKGQVIPTTKVEKTATLKYGKFHPDAKLKATGKKVTSDENNYRVKSVNGKTVKEALAGGLYSASDLNYDINKIKTLEIV